MSTSVSSFGLAANHNTLHARFLTIVPRIERHGRVVFRHVQCPVKKEEFIAEMVALCWQWIKRLAEKGRDGFEFPMALARYAGSAVKSGRRLCGQLKTRDVLSELAQQRFNFKVESLPASTATAHEHLYGTVNGQRKLDEFEDRLQHNLVTPVDEQVQFRIDFADWLSRLTPRERRIIRAMLRNERTKDISREFEVSQGRISQMRRQFMEDWKRYCGDTETPKS